VRFLAAYIATSLPVTVDPVKQMLSTGSFETALATSIFPSITLKYSKYMKLYLGLNIFKTIF
jgi:hypothetical protein